MFAIGLSAEFDQSVRERAAAVGFLGVEGVRLQGVKGRGLGPCRVKVQAWATRFIT